MSERHERPPVIVDPEAGERYSFVIGEGQKLLAGTAILDSSKPITAADVDAIRRYHKAVSPNNTENPWRLTPATKDLAAGEIVDPSNYANWEKPGGPAEHIELATQGAEVVVEYIKNHLKDPVEVEEEWAKKAIADLQSLNPHHTAAAAALHDDGRLVTHLFYTNEKIGKRALERIGVRKDIIEVLPDEAVMLTPRDQSMDNVLEQLPVEAVVVRILDEFAKRAIHTNRLKQIEDFRPAEQTDWSDRYQRKPPSGRITDQFMRERMPLHNENAWRYIKGLQKYVEQVTTVSFDSILNQLSDSLVPTLESLDKSKPFSSRDLVEGQVRKQEVRLPNASIRLEAVTECGEGNKVNEDGCVAVLHENRAYFLVVDGGTQMAEVPSLRGQTGGQYIRDQVLEHATKTNPDSGAADVLVQINTAIAADMKKNHSDIEHTEFSDSVPYGSIVGVSVDSEHGVIEIANAGDAYAIGLYTDGSVKLLTTDHVHARDQIVLQKAKTLSEQYNCPVSEVLKNKKSDPRFVPVWDEMMESLRQFNTGEIPRINGGSKFRVDTITVPLADMKRLAVCTDGAIPPDIDIHTTDGLHAFWALVEAGRVQGVVDQVKTIAESDPNLEKFPRFKKIDNILLINLSFSI